MLLIQFGRMYESKCPECGNVDRLTKRETVKTVHCQRCYFHYKYGESLEEVRKIRNGEIPRKTARKLLDEMREADE